MSPFDGADQLFVNLLGQTLFHGRCRKDICVKQLTGRCLLEVHRRMIGLVTSHCSDGCRAGGTQGRFDSIAAAGVGGFTIRRLNFGVHCFDLFIGRLKLLTKLLETREIHQITGFETRTITFLKRLNSSDCFAIDMKIWFVPMD